MKSIQLFCIYFLTASCASKNSGYNSNYQPPEVIINDPLPPEDDFGYQYPIPHPPLYDSTTPAGDFIPSNSYIPPPGLDLPKPPIQDNFPQEYPGYIPPPASLEPPQFDPPPNNPYLPPNNAYLPPNNAYLTPQSVESRRFRVTNMSCVDSPSSGSNFRAVITRTGTAVVPVIDDAPPDCVTVTSSGSGSGDVFRLDLDGGERMRRCNVRFCANGLNMCVRLRMAGVKGLKMADDLLIMLRCRPQERVAAHTKQLRINAQNTIQQGRSAGGISAGTSTVISGGSQRNFDTQVGLFRRANAPAGAVAAAGGAGDFTRIVAPGSSVQLGEELQLRAAVREGDGWRYSRLGDVTIHHLSGSSRGGAAEVRASPAVQLLDSAGCRDARARAICPSDPVQPTPLLNTLGLRAFMFQGMSSGDQMLMTVRVIACLHFDDCHGKTRTCDDKSIFRTNRLKRDLIPTTSTNNNIPPNNNLTISNFVESVLEFRVVAGSPGIGPEQIIAAGAGSGDENPGATKAVVGENSQLKVNAFVLLTIAVTAFSLLSICVFKVALRLRRF